MAGNVFDHLRVANQRVGYHGPVTSTIDWCELNYTHSYYIAEFINTLSNIPTLTIAPLVGWYRSVRRGVPPRLAGIYLGIAGIGLGSAGFHGTLTWEWQLMDELPMLLAASFADMVLLEAAPGKGFAFGTAGVLGWLLLNIVTCGIYLKWPSPVWFEAYFAFLTFFGVFRGIYLIYQLPKGHPTRTQCANMLTTGLLTCLLAFGIWNIDNYYCQYLRDARARLIELGVGELGHLTQGHGWWHLLMGYGTYLMYTSYIAIIMSIKDTPDNWTIKGKWFPLATPVAGGKKTAAAGKKRA